MKDYGRLVDANVNMDARVLALLGANESGKTTLLHALHELSSDDPVDDRRFSRSSPDPSTTLEGWFLLDEAERDELVDVVPEAGDVRWYVLQKSATGRRTERIHPPPVRNKFRRVALGSVLETLWSPADDAWSLDSELEALMARVSHVPESRAKRFADDDEIASLEALASWITLVDGWNENSQLLSAHESIQELIAAERVEHPQTTAERLVSSWVPDVVLFDAPSRNLLSSYDLAQAEEEGVPKALSHLFKAAGVQLSDLLGPIRAGRPEVVEDVVDSANKRLQGLFQAAWSQSNVEVRLSTDGTVLNLLIRSDGGALQRVAERSDGLRIFVGLVLFLAASESRRPILAIDEAEQHLHWDAQADLVSMLHRQEQTGQIILELTRSGGHGFLRFQAASSEAV